MRRSIGMQGTSGRQVALRPWKAAMHPTVERLDFPGPYLSWNIPERNRLEGNHLESNIAKRRADRWSLGITLRSRKVSKCGVD